MTEREAVLKCLDIVKTKHFDTSKQEYWYSTVNALGLTPAAHVNDLLYDVEFLKELFGEEETNEYGVNIQSICIYFQQFAVEFLGKLYVVNPQAPSMKFCKPEYPAGLSSEETSMLDIETKEVELKLEHLQFLIPFHTYRPSDITVYGTIPAWQFHLQEMIKTGPALYLVNWLEKQNQGNAVQLC